MAEGKARIIGNNPCFAQATGGKIGFMKDQMQLVFARLVMVN
jgi:hypothetical protein